MGEFLLLSCSQQVKVHGIPGSCKTSSILAEMNPHKSMAVSCVTFSSNAAVVFSADKDGEIVLSKANGSVISRLPVPLDQTGDLLAMCLHKNNRMLLTTDSKGTIRLWDLKYKKVTSTFSSHVQPVNCIRYNGDCTLVAAGFGNGDIVVYSALTLKRQTVIQCTDEENARTKDESAVLDLQFNPFRKDIVAVGTASGSVYVWDTLTSTLKSSFPRLHSQKVSGISYSPVNRLLLVSAGYDSMVSFLDTTKSKVITRHQASAPLTSVSFAPVGDVLAVGTITGDILLYDLRKFRMLQCIHAHNPNSIQQLMFYIDPKGLPDPVSSQTTKTAETEKPETLDTLESSPLVRDPRPPPSRVDTSLSNPRSILSDAPVSSIAKESSTVFANASSRVLPHEEFTERPALSPLPIGGTNALLPRPDMVAKKTEPVSPSIIRSDDATLMKSRFDSTNSLEAESSIPIISTSTKIAPSSKPADSPIANITHHDATTTATETRKILQVSKPIASQIGSNGMGTQEKVEEDHTRKHVASSGSIPNINSQEIMELIEDLREEHREDMRNLQLEMMRQFRIQMDDIANILDKFTSKFAQLTEENKELREQNEYLKNLY